MLLSDLEGVGLARSDALALLDQRADVAGIEHELSGALGDYVRHLPERPPIAPTSLPSTMAVPVPVRLIDRARNLTVRDAVSSCSIDDLIRWELAAAVSGRTLTEWGYFAALRGYSAAATRAASS